MGWDVPYRYCHLNNTPSFRLLEHILDDIRVEIAAFYKISETIGLLDMLLSLAQTASVNDYGKRGNEKTHPTFSVHLASLPQLTSLASSSTGVF
jgi:DNA mismatch repair ATPase MutS